MWWLLWVLPTVLAGPSQRGKCALECYSRCMQSGIPSAVYCNCPVDKTQRTCSSVDTKLQNAQVVATVPEVKTEYLDAHSIRIEIPPQPLAFAYVFEYSTISTRPDEWFFAGASTKPSVTVTVLDSCRDYQFRVIVVVRSTNPSEEFIIYRPRAIPVELPPFVIETDQITVESPMLNSTSDMLKVFVKWTLPRGYSDGDIHGYEAPALYPMQCRTPEEELPQPKIEIMRGGGRLVVSLPSSVLEARCRLWVEVRMLPRCVRVEPYSIQKNIEIDCERNPQLEVCSKDASPVCTDIIEVWGRDGKPKIAWESPIGKTPLYYHVRYGPAQLKGVAPFVSWQLVSKKDVKVEGTVTSMTVEIPQDAEYGVQVCAIQTLRRKRPKFGVVRVTAFKCSSCNQKSDQQQSQECGNCAVVEGPAANDRSWSAVGGHIMEKVKPQNVSNGQTVFRMETDLMVAGQSPNNLLAAQANTQKTVDTPLSLDRAGEIIHEATSRTLVEPTTTMSTTTIEEITTTKEAVTSSTSTTTSTTTTTTTTEKEEEEDNRVELTKELQESVRNLERVLEEQERNKTLLPDKILLEATLEEPKPDEEKEVKEIERDIVAIEKLIPLSSEDRDEPEPTITESTTVVEEKHTTTIENQARGAKTHVLETDRTRTKSLKCLLANGIVCEFGCENKKTCICRSTHLLLPTGACVTAIPKHTSCLRKRDLNATWDPITMTIQVKSNEAVQHINTMKSSDTLFVEFGRVRSEKLSMNFPNMTIGGFVFDDVNTHKMIIATEKLLRTGSFSEEPFVFHVKQPIDITQYIYGMRLCTYDSTYIKDPYQHNWDSEASTNQTGSIVQVVQLSAIHFTNDLHGDFMADNYWMLVFNIGKVILIIVLVLIFFLLVYLNCSKLKTLYDRKRTHYFRPYYIDPQVHVTSSSRCYSSRYTSGLPRTEQTFYDTRHKVL